MSPDFLTQLILNRSYRPISMFLQWYGRKREIFSKVNLTLQIKHPLVWWLGKLSEAAGLDNCCRSLPTEIFYSILTLFPFLLSPHCCFHVWGSDCIVLLCSSVLSILNQNYFNKISSPGFQAQKVQISIHLLNDFFWPFKFLGDWLIMFIYLLISVRSCFSLCFTDRKSVV